MLDAFPLAPCGAGWKTPCSAGVCTRLEGAYIAAMRSAFFPALVTVAALSVPAQAQSPLTAREFEDYVAGKTLFYGQFGQPYGVEEYLPGRRVRWSFLDGDCIDGRWYPQDGAICFAYDGMQGPECWQFFLGTRGLSAKVFSDPEGEPLYEVEQSSAPMVCLGPRIGV